MYSHKMHRVLNTFIRPLLLCLHNINFITEMNNSVTSLLREKTGRTGFSPSFDLPLVFFFIIKEWDAKILFEERRKKVCV